MAQSLCLNCLISEYLSVSGLGVITIIPCVTVMDVRSFCKKNHCMDMFAIWLDGHFNHMAQKASGIKSKIAWGTQNWGYLMWLCKGKFGRERYMYPFPGFLTIQTPKIFRYFRKINAYLRICLQKFGLMFKISCEKQPIVS